MKAGGVAQACMVMTVTNMRHPTYLIDHGGHTMSLTKDDIVKALAKETGYPLNQCGRIDRDPPGTHQIQPRIQKGRVDQRFW